MASCAAGLGAALVLGADYTSITVVVLFLVFGVGVDDIVLLFGADHDVPAALASSVRAVKTMTAAGPMVSAGPSIIHNTTRMSSRSSPIEKHVFTSDEPLSRAQHVCE